MASTSDFRNGLCLEYNHGLYIITEFQHVKPGKGPAFVRTKLKNISTGKVIDNTFTAGHKIVTARIERRKHQFLYKDDLGYHFMNAETYDQINISEDLIVNADLMKDGQEVDVLFHAEQELVLTCELPSFVTLRVIYTEPGMKGDTATNTLKPADLDTGARINVPLFINQDQLIKVDTRDRSYVERIKE